MSRGRAVMKLRKHALVVIKEYFEIPCYAKTTSIYLQHLFIFFFKILLTVLNRTFNDDYSLYSDSYLIIT